MYYIFASLAGLSVISSVCKPLFAINFSPIFDILPTMFSWLVWPMLLPFIGVEWAFFGLLIDILGVLPVFAFLILTLGKSYVNVGAGFAYSVMLGINTF